MRYGEAVVGKIQMARLVNYEVLLLVGKLGFYYSGHTEYRIYLSPVL